VPTLQDDWESAVPTTKPKSLGLEDDWKNSQIQSEWESAEPEEGETEGKNTVINSLQDIARFFITPATAGLSAIGTGIGEAAAGGELSTGLTKGAQSEEFKGIPFVDIPLGAETTPGKWVEEKLGKILGSIREFGGEKAPELIKNETSREVMKALPGIGSLVRLYEELPEDGKSTIEAALSAGGAAAPEVLLMLLGGKGAKKLVEKEPTIAGETSTIDSMLADLEQQVPTTKLKEELSLVPREEIPIIESAIEQRISERTVGELDPIYEEAVAHVIEKGRAAVSDVRRKFGISADRAERLIGEMEKQGLVTTELTNGSRKLVKEPTQEGMIINASGESVASAEAISRLQDQNAKGIKVYEVDPERNGLTPLNTVDRVDKKPAKGNAIVSVGGDGTMTVIENNSRFGNEPLKNRTVSLIEKDLGLTGAGKGQRGAISFKQEPKTLEQKAKILTREDWTKEFAAKYPDKVQHADTIYDKLNPVKEIPTKKAFADNIVLNIIDYGIGAVSTRIGNIHPRLQQKSVDFEYYNLKNTAQRLGKVDDFLADINNLNKKDLDFINSKLLDNDYEGLRRFLPPKIKQKLSSLEEVLKQVGEDLKKYGIIEYLRENYFPRLVIDVDGLLGALGTTKKTQLEKILAEKQQKAMSKGESLTEFDKSEIINSYLKNNYNTKGSPGFAKERVLNTIPEELRKFYATPTKGLHSYLRYTTFQIEQAKFFGKHLVRDSETNKVHIGESIGNLVTELVNKGELKPEQIVEYHNILNSRFSKANASPNAIVQGFKDAVNIGLLGDITNGLMQAADVGTAIALDGVRPTIQAVVAKLRGKEQLRARDIGLLNHIADEFVSDRLSTRATNTIFKLNTLSKIDQTLKDINLGSSIEAGKRAAIMGDKKADLYTRYEKRFGKEFPQLVSDLKQGRRTDLTDRFAFSQLSMRQPISKLESSQWAMESPNIARGALTLKSFMLKQADLIRNYSYNEIKKGNVKQGITNLAKIGITLAATNTTMKTIIDYISNKPIDKDPSLLANFFKIFGYNEYFSDKIQRGAFGEAVEDIVTPPVRAFDPLYKDVVAILDNSEETKFSGKAIQFLPFFGNELYGYSEYGKKAKAKKERKESKKNIKEQYGI